MRLASSIESTFAVSASARVSRRRCPGLDRTGLPAHRKGASAKLVRADDSMRLQLPPDRLISPEPLADQSDYTALEVIAPVQVFR
jgi:hypothetical protein